MILNEASLLERCFKAVLPIVDAVAVADTGSTDRSLDIIRETIGNFNPNIPLSIETNEWKNFGHNRTLGLRQAQRFAEQLGWPDAQILLLDADMVLVVSPQFNKESLTLDQYSVEQIAGTQQYWNTRLVKASASFVCVGATHEYYQSLLPVRSAQLETLKIDDRNDGANRGDKYGRDERLLLGDLRENSKNARAMFYLAQTYQHRNDPTKKDLQNAIHWYNQHLATGSWEEEQWYSMYCVGQCYELEGNWPNAIDWYLKAYLRRPSRVEPLYKIGKYYRDRDQHHLAMIFFARALEIPFPQNDILFVEANLYNYDVDYHTSISAYYADKKDVGWNCIEKLLRKRNIPGYLRHSVLYNSRFYIQPLPNLKRCTPLQPKLYSNSNYNPCNPSLLVVESKRKSDLNELLICVRGVNYTQSCARNYKSQDSDGIFRTRNCLMKLIESVDAMEPMEPMEPIGNGDKEDKVANKITTYDIVNSKTLTGPYVNTCTVRGLEDARLFMWKSKLFFSCTSLEHTIDNSPRICVAELSNNETSSPNFDIVNITKLYGFGDEHIQKNWLPFVIKDQLYFIYSYNPLTILHCPDPYDGRVIVKHTTDTTDTTDTTTLNCETSGFRGSAGPIYIPSERCYLLTIHEVYDTSDHRRYMHRFVRLSDCMSRITHISPMFYFKHGTGVEMNLGLALSSNGEDVYATIGIEDKEAYLLQYKVQDIFNFTNCQVG